MKTTVIFLLLVFLFGQSVAEEGDDNAATKRKQYLKMVTLRKNSFEASREAFEKSKYDAPSSSSSEQVSEEENTKEGIPPSMAQSACSAGIH